MNIKTKEYLDYYLEDNTSEQAILLTGAWGCGKTHFIDEYIKNNKYYSFIKISLFGINDIDSINKEIFKILHPIRTSTQVKFVKSVVVSLLKFDIDINGDGIKDLKLDLSNKFKDKHENVEKDIILVLDDIERTDIEMKMLLGYVNKILTECNTKVILLASQDDIHDDKKDEFKKFKEKVIGKTLSLNNNTKEILTSIIKRITNNEYKPSVLTHIDIEYLTDSILKTNSRLNCENIRFTKQLISDLLYIVPEIDITYLNNKNFINSFVDEFFTYGIQLKKGLEVTPKNNIKYSILSKEQYKEIINNGRINKNELKESIDKSIFFKTETERRKQKEAFEKLAPIDKLYEFQIMDEQSLISTLKTLKNDLSCNKYTNDLKFLRSFSMLLFFNETNIFNIDKITLNNIAESFMDQNKNKNLGESNIHEIPDSLSNRYDYIKLENKESIDLLYKIKIKNNEAYQSRCQERNITEKNAIINYIKEKRLDDVYETLINSKNTQPVFHNLKKEDASDLIDSIFNYNNEELTKFSTIFLNRYNNNLLYNGKEYYKYFSDDYVFFTYVLDELTCRLSSKKSNLTKYLLSRLAYQIEYIILKNINPENCK